MASSPAIEEYMAGELTPRDYAVAVREEAKAEVKAQLWRRLQIIDLGGTAAQESLLIISPESDEESA